MVFDMLPCNSTVFKKSEEKLSSEEEMLLPIFNEQNIMKVKKQVSKQCDLTGAGGWAVLLFLEKA